MPTPLTIHLSDAALARLTERAAALGTTPEAVAAADLEPADPPAVKPGDFLKHWVGAIRSDVPDWGTRHDELIGAALHEELKRARPE